MSFDEFKKTYDAFVQNYQHRVRLKSIKIFAAMSEETECFKATIYIDDERVGTVSNRGHGGCHDYSDHRTARRVSDELRESEVEAGREPMAGGLDALVNAALADHMMLKDARKWSKAGNIAFSLPNSPVGTWRMVGWPEIAKTWPDKKSVFEARAIKSRWFDGADPSDVKYANDLLVD